ncbi:MAG TPA: aminotransferase class V-fold PLP-dependent enzyme [Bryobacteraceae bacterium]|jgi:selenocysteine lyase/cysteine desulfurase|nr:aminotransferase class V-fold PLP-dependent enzyme [Bryobacteraceae bacterium]
MPDWSQLRQQFPSLKSPKGAADTAAGGFPEGWTYLDTASFGQIPVCASAAMIEHLTHRDQTASSQFMSWFDDIDALRDACAQLIHCERSDIAFVPSASIGLSYLMNGITWNSGDEVLTLSDDFPNQLYQGPLASRFGVLFRAVPWPEFYSSITERTRLVLLSTINYATGFRPPLEEIASYLRERRILLYLDGTQSLGALQFDVGQIRPAMFCVDAYKWMLSPNGAGFIYVDPELRRHLKPSVVGWRSDFGWRQVNQLNHADPVFADSAEKYEGGMLCFPSLYAMRAVVSLLLEIGPHLIEARVLELASKTRAMLRDFGAQVNADNSQIVTARVPNLDSGETARFLKQNHIVISARHGRLRVSPHFYNNEDDIESLRLSLRAARASIRI